jgi:hypothetical protein
MLKMKLDPSIEGLGDEGYRLEISPDRILLKGSTSAGIFYAEKEE